MVRSLKFKALFSDNTYCRGQSQSAGSENDGERSREFHVRFCDLQRRRLEVEVEREENGRGGVSLEGLQISLLYIPFFDLSFDRRRGEKIA